MNGYEIYNKASIRLGYKGNGRDEVSDSRLTGRILEFLNQIIIDLKLEPVNSLSENLSYSNDVLETICCGVAMMMSLSEGDTNKNVIFTALYNAKRMTALSKTDFIKDTLPVAEG